MPAPRTSSKQSRRAKGEAKRSGGAAKALAGKTARAAGMPDSLTALVEQLINRVIKPFDLVLLSRERIQETLDEAAERGRVTRTDANALVLELVQRGRQQTDDLASQIENLWGRGLGGLGTATRRGRRSEGEAGELPIADYDELTARQVVERLRDLDARELRAISEYERRHLNRKSVLQAAERGQRRG